MTWTKVDDRLPDKLIELSDAAFRLHLSSVVYANRVSSDGRISKAQLALVPVPARTKRPAIVSELVAAGMWADDGDAWTIVDFLEDQPSAVEVRLTKDWHAARQRARMHKTDESGREHDDQAKAILADLQAAREHRTSPYLAATSSASSSATGSAPSRERKRPVPTPVEDEVERAQPDAPLGGASAAPDGNADPDYSTTCYVCEKPLGSADGSTGATRASPIAGVVREIHARCSADLGTALRMFGAGHDFDAAINALIECESRGIGLPELSEMFGQDAFRQKDKRPAGRLEVAAS